MSNYATGNLSNHAMTEDKMGQHLIAEAERKLMYASKVGRQFKKKHKLIVPTCAQIIPDRYKANYEEMLE